MSTSLLCPLVGAFSLQVQWSHERIMFDLIHVMSSAQPAPCTRVSASPGSNKHLFC